MAAVVPNESQVLERSERTVASKDQPQRCVLLIEDSEDSMLLVRHALQFHGRGRYRLIWAHNLIEGMEQFGSEQVDITLLDLGLPDSSGPVSYAWIRQIAPQVPVIVLTGDTSQETEFSVLASGAQDYLVKSEMSPPALIHAIERLLPQGGNHRRLY